jgi:hypothetical protein
MADVDKDVKWVRLNPLSLRKEYEDNEGNKDHGMLSWGIRAGYPRINVYTSNAKKADDAKFDFNTFITAPFDYVTFGILLQRLNEVIESKTQVNYDIDCFNIKFEKGVKTNDIYLQAKVHVGRDEEGVVYIAAVEEGKRKLKFYLLPSDKFFKFYDKDRNVIEDKHTLSSLYAKSYVKLLTRIMEKESYKDMVKENMAQSPQKTTLKQQYKQNTPANNVSSTESSIEDLM